MMSINVISKVVKDGFNCKIVRSILFKIMKHQLSNKFVKEL